MFGSIKAALFGTKEDRVLDAIVGNRIQGVKEYLQSNGDPNLALALAGGRAGIQPRSLAVWTGIYNFPEALWVLLDAGANPKSIDPNDGRSLLHFAANWNDVPLTKHLMKCGVNPNGGGKYPSPPLYIAAARNHLEVARELIAGGADVSGTNWAGVSPLEALGWATEGGGLSGTNVGRDDK